MGTCPTMTILENMSLADNKGKAFNLRPGTNRQRLEYYRESLRSLGLGLEDKMDVKVGVLSGGPAPGHGPSHVHHDLPLSFLF